MLQKPVETKDNEKVSLSFLRKTKEGKYALIEKSSLPYSRIVEESEAEVIESLEERFYYSVS